MNKIEIGDFIVFDRYVMKRFDFIEELCGIVLHIETQKRGYLSGTRSMTFYRILTPKGIYNVDVTAIDIKLVNKLKAQ